MYRERMQLFRFVGRGNGACGLGTNKNLRISRYFFLKKRCTSNRARNRFHEWQTAQLLRIFALAQKTVLQNYLIWLEVTTVALIHWSCLRFGANVCPVREVSNALTFVLVFAS
jgi:hypothetical protein